MKTIKVTCRDSLAVARQVKASLPGAKMTRPHGKPMLVSVPDARLDDAIDLLDESDDVTAYEYALDDEED